MRSFFFRFQILRLARPAEALHSTLPAHCFFSLCFWHAFEWIMNLCRTMSYILKKATGKTQPFSVQLITKVIPKFKSKKRKSVEQSDLKVPFFLKFMVSIGKYKNLGTAVYCFQNKMENITFHFYIINHSIIQIQSNFLVDGDRAYNPQSERDIRFQLLSLPS